MHSAVALLVFHEHLCSHAPRTRKFGRCHGHEAYRCWWHVNNTPKLGNNVRGGPKTDNSYVRSERGRTWSRGFVKTAASVLVSDDYRRRSCRCRRVAPEAAADLAITYPCSRRCRTRCPCRERWKLARRSSSGALPDTTEQICVSRSASQAISWTLWVPTRHTAMFRVG